MAPTLAACLTVCLCVTATNDSNINAIFGKPATPNGQNASRGSSGPNGGQSASRESSGPNDSAFSGDFGGEASRFPRRLLCVLIRVVQLVMLCVIATTDSLAEAWELLRLPRWVAEGLLLMMDFVSTEKGVFSA